MAQALRDKSYLAWAMEGGFRAWRDAGYPLEPKTIELQTTLEDVCPECGQPHATHSGPGSVRLN